MAESDVVTVRALRKTYGSRVVVDQLDLDVRPGEIVGLASANGAGKTPPSSASRDCAARTPARSAGRRPDHRGRRPAIIAHVGAAPVRHGSAAPALEAVRAKAPGCPRARRRLAPKLLR